MTTQSVDFGALLAANNFSAPDSMRPSGMTPSGGDNVGKQTHVIQSYVQTEQIGAVVPDEKIDEKIAQQSDRVADKAVNPEQNQELSGVKRFEELTQQQAQELEKGLVTQAEPAKKEPAPGPSMLDDKFQRDLAPLLAFVASGITEIGNGKGDKAAQGVDCDHNNIQCNAPGPQPSQSRGAAIA